PELYTLSLHDALPISCHGQSRSVTPLGKTRQVCWQGVHKVNRQVIIRLLERPHFLALRAGEAEGIDLLFLELGDELLRLASAGRSEEHTSELQSRENL